MFWTIIHTTNSHIIKYGLCILIIFSVSDWVVAQSANSWIRFDQAYLKVSIAKDGLYRITFSDLAASGFPSGVDPKTLQLFHSGVEQQILVMGENDGQFNSTDYIEFFGKRNDGKLDTKLYINSSAQPHTYYNLYSDTASYFLTIGSVAGKRMSLYSGTSTLPSEVFHWDEKLLILSSQYSAGVDQGYIQQSIFDIGEGWMGNQILQTQTGNYKITGITNTQTSSAKPQLEILLTGRGPMMHAVELYNGSRLLTNISFSGFESYKHAQTLEWSDIESNGDFNLNVKVLGVGGQPDRISVNYIKIRYPQKLDMENISEKVFTINKNSSGLSYLEVQRAPAATRLFDITDPGTTYQLATTGTTTLNARVPSATTERTILATNSFVTPKLKRIKFRDLSNSTANFVIITHPSLRKPAVGYTDPVKAYGEYRASDQGGSYDTMIVNIQQLYDQFNYGEQSPLAITQFMEYLAKSRLPDYLLLIGKGLAVNYGYYRNPTGFTAYKDLVPTAGYPGSDALFTAGINGTTYDPAVATGRLSVSRPEEVSFYLNKVKETEARSFDDLRRKKILHLSGGIEEYQLEQFRLIMKEFESIGESFYVGADVTAASKQSTDIQLVNIAEELNNGLGFITFFGHSAPSTLDFDIGYVTNPIYGYKNKGKYPALLLNGCSAGDAFLYGEITGENWVNARDQGLVAFIAHSSFGFVNTLRNYTTTFYNVAFGDSVFINKGVGDVHKEVAKRYLNTFGVNDINITQAQQMVLQGDPALKLFPATKPDYEVDEAILTAFDGKEITALTDSFKLSFVVRNFGKAVKKKFNIQVTRQPANGKTVTYDSIFNPVLYSDTITFIIKSNDKNSYGNNMFTVKLDADDQLDELNETNNTYTIRYFIPLNGTKNLYPTNYAIINRQNIDVSFQSTDLLSKERDYLLEVDTTATFNSPYKTQFIVRGNVLAKQSLSLLSNDSTVYFWRTKFAAPSAEESNEWNVSSFTYIDGSPPGWAQVDFAQFVENATTGLVKDTRIERLNFEESVADVSINTFSSAAGKPLDSISFKINNVEYNIYQDGAGCRYNTINMVAFDRKSTRPYVGLYFKWYEPGRRLICGREPFAINSFTPFEMVTGNGDDLISYVDNIFEGDSVVLFNIGNAGYQSWPAEAKAKLAEFGIATAQIEQLADGEPVVIFGRKGATPGSAKIYRLSDAGSLSKLSVKRSITGRYNAGEMTSVVIGPAKRWQRFVAKYTEMGTDDEVDFDIEGINIDGREVLVKNSLTGDEDLTSVDAAEYPYLKVTFNTKDDILLTAVQLKKWLVLYEPVAEGILLYRGTADREVLAEGASHKMTYSFINISESQFGSDITVSYKLRNVTGIANEESVNVPAPLPGDTVTFDLDVSTIGQAGENDLEVFANPYVLPELFYDNNVISLFKHLEVIADVTNPVLEVMIDGRYLSNNDFVSPSPEIRIRLWDENEYLKKADTTGLNVYLAYPCDEDVCDFRRIAFSEPEMKWFAATDTSDFMVYFTPQNLSPGKYTLRVEAKDVTGNLSGNEPYSINFQVNSETEVIFDPPFPNPFLENVSFRFLLTGKTLPDYFRLRIYDLKGIMVKELTENDIPRIFIGSNTISYQGDDNQKKLLPGGVFIYRLSLQSNGRMFTDYGKIVLAR